MAANLPPPGPAPKTPLTAEELAETEGQPEEARRSALLRSLEYYGAVRVGEGELEVPFGLGPAARRQVVDPAAAPLALLLEAASACVTAKAARELEAAERGGEAAERADGGQAGLAAPELQLARRFCSKCPAFATADANAMALAVLLLWSFPDAHGVHEPMSTEQWEELLAHLRAHAGSDGVAHVREAAERHATAAGVEALLDAVRHEGAEAGGFGLGWPTV